MANPSDSAGTDSAGSDSGGIVGGRRRRSARREQGPPQPTLAQPRVQIPAPDVRQTPAFNGAEPENAAAQPQVRLERLERKRARKPRRGSAESHAAPVSGHTPAPNSREGRRSRHRLRGQQSATANQSAQAGDSAAPGEFPHGLIADPTLADLAPTDSTPVNPTPVSSTSTNSTPTDSTPVNSRPAGSRTPAHKQQSTRSTDPESKPAESNHVSPPARSADRARDVENLPRTARDRRNELAERALRGLVTTRGTQVSWTAALRARDVASPTAADMAEAEKDLIIVRRNYTPPEPLPTSRKGAPDQRSDRPDRPQRRGQRQSGKGF